MINGNKKASVFITNPSNYIKLIAMLLLGVLLILSLILLVFAYRNQKHAATPPVVVATDPESIKTAEETIDSLLIQNTLKIIKGHRETGKYLEIKVDSGIWRNLSTREKKQFLKDLSSARISLGLVPDVRVIDFKTGIEFAALERGRVGLSGHDD